MRPNTSLALAIVFGVAAVGLVTAETLYGLEVLLEARDDTGAWRTVASHADGDQTGRYGPYGIDGGCQGPLFRLTVDNHKPFGGSMEVHATIYNRSSQRTETLLSETWSVGAFEVRQTELTVPSDGYEQTDPRTGEKLAGVRDLRVRVGPDVHLSACVAEVDP